MYSAKDRQNLPPSSSRLKKVCVRRVVLDKWLPVTPEERRRFLRAGRLRRDLAGGEINTPFQFNALSMSVFVLTPVLFAVNVETSIVS